jgi:hypothetical protein
MNNNIIMKFTTIAFASGFALFGTVALAKTDRSVAKKHHGAVSKFDPHPSYGNPGGPATSRGSGKSYAVPGWTDEQTQTWIDSASGPKG